MAQGILASGEMTRPMAMESYSMLMVIFMKANG